MDSARGQLLIAGPGLADENFWRTVVLVIEHSRQGALGLVLNRPSETTVSEAAAELQELLEADEPLFVGGPVATTALIVLAEFARPAEAAIISFDNVGVLASDVTEQAPPEIRRSRGFVGHAGWGPGQLDAEVERGDWFLEPARLTDAFTPSPEDLWEDVLTRKGGSYALVARMPADPSLN